MLLSQALDAIHKFTPHEFSALSDLLSPELTDPCLADTGVVILRKRRLSMEMMALAVTGMALFLFIQATRANFTCMCCGLFLIPTRKDFYE